MVVRVSVSSLSSVSLRCWISNYLFHQPFLEGHTLKWAYLLTFSHQILISGTSRVALHQELSQNDKQQELQGEALPAYESVLEIDGTKKIIQKHETVKMVTLSLILWKRFFYFKTWFY